MLFGVPFAWIFIFVTWIYLIKIAFPSKLKTMPGGRAVIDKQKKDLGAASIEEKLVFVVFALAAFSWITRTFLLSKDRKSTRLNSSHVKISYAVFCLKK